MTSQQILQTDLLDILFEHRNKAYGAYQLRKEYNRQLLKGITVAVSAAFLLLLFFKPSPTTDAVAKEKGDVILKTVELPKTDIKKPETVKPLEIPKPQPKQVNFTTNIQMKQNIEVTIPPVDAMDSAAISNRNTPGDVVGNVQPPEAEAKSNGAEITTSKPEPEKEIVPDRQPQFPGGSNAWMNFLRNNLRAPDALESGEKRTVVIGFHVAEDGSVADFMVVQSAGNSFDGEVMRVLKKMPKWTPATKGGQPVSVSFNQPVTFVGVEE